MCHSRRGLGRQDGWVNEDKLEPVSLIQQSGVVLRLGRMMLASGTASYRVKMAMRRLAFALGLDRHEALVTLTEITTTSHRGPIFRTEVAEQHTIGANADRLTRLERYADSLESGVTVEEAERSLDEIAAVGPLHGPVANALFAGMACAGFAFLNRGGVIECSSVFVAASLGQAARRAMHHRSFNQFGTTMVAAAVASFAYLGIVVGLRALGVASPSNEVGFVSAVLFLVPGFVLVTAVLDIVKMDLSAGIGRMVYGLMILVSAGIAVSLVSMMAGLEPKPGTEWGLPAAALVPAWAIASWAAGLGFALLFNSPWRMALAAAMVGMVANTGRIALVEVGLVPQVAAGLAALVVVLLSAVVGPRVRVPRITLNVPGFAIYRSMVSINAGDYSAAVGTALQTTFVVMAIGVGLAVGRMMTDNRWTFDK
jgi:uncharacterized membrane protein YjjP (DUF1212 family)